MLISLKTKETPCCLETAGPGGQTLPALLAERFSAVRLCGLPRHRAGGCRRARGLGKARGWRGAAAALVKATPRPELGGTKPPRREIGQPKGRTLHAAAKCIRTTAPLLVHPARCTEPPLADHPAQPCSSRALTRAGLILPGRGWFAARLRLSHRGSSGEGLRLSIFSTNNKTGSRVS